MLSPLSRPKGVPVAGEIFISYRRADRGWAKLLHDQLQAEGVEAWYDARVGAGQDWRQATAKALEQSQIFVLLFTANAAQSSDIAKELAAATLEKKLIVPVRLENIAPKGAFLYELASRNWINAFENTEARLEDLARSLAEMVRTGVRDESVLPFDDEPVARHRWSLKSALIAAASLAIVAAAGTAAWLFWPAKHWTAESSRRFISTLAVESNPSFSPDGKMLAYTVSADGLQRKIHVRTIAGGDGIKVTNDAYDDYTATWASDGGRIAYLASKAGEPCRIMVTTVPAGETRQVGRCREAVASTLTWQPHSPFLWFTDLKGIHGRYISRLNLDTGERLDLKRPLQWITTMRASWDSKSLVFLDWVKLLTYRIVIRDIESGKEKQLGLVIGDFTSTLVAWSEDSRAVFVGVGGAGNQTIDAYPVDGSPSYHVYATASNIYSMAVGAGGQMALETDLSRKNLARMSTTPVAQPDIVDPASGTTRAPTFAPDGSLAFVSNRSGRDAIWLAKAGAQPERLREGDGALLRALAFSPDGTRLTVTSVTPKSVMVKVLTVEGADVSSFEAANIGVGAPTWTPDGKALVLFRDAEDCYLRIDAVEPAIRKKLPNCAFDGIVYRPNGIFGMRVDRPGVWRLDGTPKLLNPKYPPRLDVPIAFQGDEILIPEMGPSVTIPRILAQPVDGGAERVLGYAPGAAYRINDFQSAFAVNPKTKEVFYTADIGRDPNIDLLTLVKH